MEDLSAKELKEILTIGLYVIAALLAIASKLFKKRSGRRQQDATGQFDFPNAEPEKPVVEVPKPRPHKKKRAPRPAAATVSATVSAEPETRKYFTYEDETDFESAKYMSASKSATAEQSENTSAEHDEYGSSVDFDLRAAVIASEILKPKFEE